MRCRSLSCLGNGPSIPNQKCFFEGFQIGPKERTQQIGSKKLRMPVYSRRQHRLLWREEDVQMREEREKEKRQRNKKREAERERQIILFEELFHSLCSKLWFQLFLWLEPGYLTFFKQQQENNFLFLN